MIQKVKISCPTILCLLMLTVFSPYSLGVNENANPNRGENGEENWDNNWEEEQTIPWVLSGFSEFAKGQFLQNNVVGSETQLYEQRTRLNFNYSHDLFELKAKGDLLYDDIISDKVSDILWQVRELNISSSTFEILDIKLGRQVLTWGTGDYLFLNDLFPKDWQSFFSGRDDEYLKAASNSMRTTWYFGEFSLDLAWAPTFTADKYLTGERFSFYSPQADKIIAPADKLKVKQTAPPQWFARLATTKNGIEYAFYGYKGLWTTPAGINLEGLPYFPKLNTWGASARMPLAEGVFNAEFSYYNSLEDPYGNDANIANDQFKLLVGYERELVKNLTASMQYYLERTEDYDNLKESLKANSPVSNKLVDKNRQLVTLRLTHFAFQHKLTSSLFVFYSSTDKDSYIKQTITYRYNDSWLYAIGANIFNGQKNYSFFGQHQDNSNMWLRVRYQF